MTCDTCSQYSRHGSRIGMSLSLCSHGSVNTPAEEPTGIIKKKKFNANLIKIPFTLNISFSIRYPLYGRTYKFTGIQISHQYISYLHSYNTTFYTNYPFNTQEDNIVLFDRIFNFLLRRDHKKKIT